MPCIASSSSFVLNSSSVLSTSGSIPLFVVFVSSGLFVFLAIINSPFLLLVMVDEYVTHIHLNNI